VLSTPGQVHSVTVGSWTLNQADAVAGGGCTDMNLVNGSSSQSGELKATYQTSGNSNGAENYYYDNVTPGDNYTDIIGGNQLDETFQAVLNNGSSMISGLVGSWNGTTQASGNVPCIDVGGVAGT
jgi:hypothetical protein